MPMSIPMPPTTVEAQQDAELPCLVLLPGLDGTGRMFTPFIERRPMQQPVQVIGYPGDEPLNYDQLFSRIWSQLPHGRPFVVLGESFSGPLAVRVAAEAPAGLCGVVLCASFVTSPTPWYIRWWPSLFSARVVKTLVKLEGWASRPMLGRCKFEMKALNRDARHQVCPEVIAHRVRSTMTVDVRQELQNLSVPLLYLAGRWDLVVPKRSRTQIQRLRPDTELQVIDGPHALLQARPDLAWTAIMEWAATLPSTARIEKLAG